MSEAKSEAMSDEAKSDKPAVLIAFPGYGNVRVDAAFGVAACNTARFGHVHVKAFGGSLLARNFNILWCLGLRMAAQGEITHFAMLHTDIAPEAGWLDTLYDVMQETGAKHVSAVVPIKDARGLTSCGIDRDDSRFHVRRITLAEAHKDLPDVFDTAATVKAGLNPDGRALLTNTGCWLADLRDPRWHLTDAEGVYKLSFTIRDRIATGADGPKAEVESEDWYFAREMHAAGIPYCATRRVKLVHHGEWGFANDTVWGTVMHETEYEASA